MQEKYKHNFSIGEYLVSFPSNSCIKADPIVWLSADTYNLKGLPCWWGTSTGGDFIYSFISSNAFCCMSPYLNSWSFFNFNKGENGRTLSDKFKINFLIKLILPSKDCNYILVVGDTAPSIAFILFWPISIPLSWTIRPKNYPADNTKAHLLGFIFKPCFLVHSKVSHKLARCSLYPLDFTTTSSM